MSGPLQIKGLPKLVQAAFKRALSQEEVIFHPTDVALVELGNTLFQLRFAPSLARKPDPGAAGPDSPDPWHELRIEDVYARFAQRLRDKEVKRERMLANDVFANPPDALRIADLGPDHYLVLNKFAVTAEHFIVATNEFKDQDDLLEREDVAAVLACIKEYDCPDGGDGLYAFFNGGEYSGASQAHRHIQMIPMSRMKDGLASDTPWSAVIDKLDAAAVDIQSMITTLPFSVVIRNIAGMDVDAVFRTYLDLYRLACEFEANINREPDRAENIPLQGSAQISYNLAMTKNTMVILPRIADKVALLDKKGKPLGVDLSVNGTILAGTVLIKDQHAYETIKTFPRALHSALQSIGVPDYVAEGRAGVDWNEID